MLRLAEVFVLRRIPEHDRAPEATSQIHLSGHLLGRSIESTGNIQIE